MHAAHNNPYAGLEFTMADRLEKALAFADVSVQDMADALGVSRQTVSNYTAGRTRPSKLAIREWSMRTGAPLAWILTGQFPDEGTKKGPASEETGPLLPEMDSNHQPAGYKFAAKRSANLTVVGEKPNVTPLPKRTACTIAAGEAVVTDFAVTQ